MKVKSEREVAQSRLTLSDPMDWRLLGSFVYGNFQARVLEWGAIALYPNKDLDPGTVHQNLSKSWHQYFYKVP